MWMRLLRHGLLACLLAALSSVLMPHSAPLYAGANDGGTCYTESATDSFYYDGTYVTSVFGNGNGVFPTPDACVSYAQGDAIYWAGGSCIGVSRGTYGVMYADVSWKVWYNGEDLTADGPVRQRYDCGDISRY